MGSSSHGIAVDNSGACGMGATCYLQRLSFSTGSSGSDQVGMHLVPRVCEPDAVSAMSRKECLNKMGQYWK